MIKDYIWYAVALAVIAIIGFDIWREHRRWIRLTKDTRDEEDHDMQIW